VPSENYVALARRLVERTDEAKLLEQKAKQAERDRRDAEADMWDAMYDARRKSETLDLDWPWGTVQLVRRDTIRAIIKDKDLAARSLRKAGYADAVIDPTYGIRQKALNDHVRDCIRTGAPIPEGVDFTVTRYVTITRKDD
jgi:hypothetical protein